MKRITYTKSPMNSQLTVVALALPFIVGLTLPLHAEQGHMARITASIQPELESYVAQSFGARSHDDRRVRYHAAGAVQAGDGFPPQTP